MEVIKRQGGIEPHVVDLQSKCKPFTNMSLFVYTDHNHVTETCVRLELTTLVSVAQHSDHWDNTLTMILFLTPV